MKERVAFNSKKIRNKFFLIVLQTKNLTRWKDLTAHFNLSRKLLEDYRSGKTTIPKSLYDRFCSNFSEDNLIHFNKFIEIKDNNWGRIKGGHMTYHRYKSIFEGGRLKGIEKLKELNSKPEFDINMPLNKELAYFIGLFIGDGFCNKYGRHYQIQFVGHKDELIYYKRIISNISKRLFGWLPKIIENPNINFIRINFNSKHLFFMLTERFKIAAGRKSLTVLIPKEIINSSLENLLSCIAGLFDAEGSVFIDRRKIYKKPYIRFEIHMHNPNLIKQISSILSKNDLYYYLNIKEGRIIFHGNNQVKDFLKKVPIKNPKHLDKLKNLF